MHSSNLHSLVGNSVLFPAYTTKTRSKAKNNKNAKFDNQTPSGIPADVDDEECERTENHDNVNTLVNSGTLNLAADGIHVFANSVNLNSLPNREKTFLEHALETNEIIAKDLKGTKQNVSTHKACNTN